MFKLLLIMTGLVAINLSVAAESAVPPKPGETKHCLSCHPSHIDHRVNYYHGECVDCHTVQDPIHHTKGGYNVLFPDKVKCLNCHEGKSSKLHAWAFSDHNKANLNCRDCHGIHSPKELKQFNLALWTTDKKSAACMNCHQDVATRFNMPSHHPLKEGGMTCVSCHDPHGNRKTTLLSSKEQCLKCHQSVRGPKAFEHAPVTEDCGNCHNPHGSPGPRLLTVSEPVVCLQCHAIGARHGGGSGEDKRSILGSVAGIYMKCTNCHAAIHGSHADKRLRR